MMRTRSGLYAANGSMSSMDCRPVTFGLYSTISRATSTPSAARYASKRAGSTVPSSVYTPSRTPSPNGLAHVSQLILSVGRRAGCRCTSTNGRPSSTAVSSAGQDGRRRPPQLHPADLTGRGGGVRVDEHDPTRPLERRQPVPAERDQLVLVGGRVRGEHDEGDRLL